MSFLLASGITSPGLRVLSRMAASRGCTAPGARLVDSKPSRIGKRCRAQDLRGPPACVETTLWISASAAGLQGRRRRSRQPISKRSRRRAGCRRQPQRGGLNAPFLPRAHDQQRDCDTGTGIQRSSSHICRASAEHQEAAKRQNGREADAGEPCTDKSTITDLSATSDAAVTATAIARHLAMAARSTGSAGAVVPTTNSTG